MSEETIPRGDNGLQPLAQRQKHKDMTPEDQHTHVRCLLVKSDQTSRRAICWSDDVTRLAAWAKRGYVVAEDPYIDPIDSGRKKDILVIHVPMKSLGTGGAEGVGIKS